MASGNQLVATEELLESGTIATAYSRQIQHLISNRDRVLYELFAIAGISWKKTQKRKEKKDPELVQKKLEILA